MTSVQPGIYRHYKGGLYEVIGVSWDTDYLNDYVVYRSVAGKLWHREFEEFTSTVEGKPRFEFIEPQREGRSLYNQARREFITLQIPEGEQL